MGGCGRKNSICFFITPHIKSTQSLLQQKKNDSKLAAMLECVSVRGRLGGLLPNVRKGCLVSLHK